MDVVRPRSKYARVERERRFLLAGLPRGPAIRVRRITDRYFPDTSLRLRMLEEQAEGSAGFEFKLTQKTPDGLITNTYLTRVEYELLARLPGEDITKTRHSIPPFGVDLFAGPLAGLVIAEAEFATDEEMETFAPPAVAVAEVTQDPRFTGGHLVRVGRAELQAWLSEFGLTVT
jgi:CYTH domain-containing protein